MRNAFQYRLKITAILALAGSLAVAGCQTMGVDEDGNPVVSSEDAGDRYNIFWDQADHLSDLTAAGKFDDAAKLYVRQRKFFDADKARYTPRLKLLAGAINKREEPGLRAAFERINGAEWPSASNKWPDVKARLEAARKVNDAYRARPMMIDARFVSPIAVSLHERIESLTARIRAVAVEEFEKFNHFGETSYFAQYPVKLDEESFLHGQFNVVRDRLARAETADLKKFVRNYPRTIISDSDWRELSDLFLGATLRKIGKGKRSDLADVLRAITAAKELGFEPKSVPGIKIAFVEVTSKTLLKQGQIEFPAEIVADLPIEMVKADLDKALSEPAARAADYLIVFDVALAKTRRRVTGKRSMPSRLLAGYRTKPNPDYNIAQNELNQGQLEMQNAQMQSASANAQYCQGMGCLGKMLGQIASIAMISKARKKVEAAMENLRVTPMTVDIPIYQNYNYDLAVVKGTKLMTVHYYVIDRRNKTYLKSTFDVVEKKTFNVAYSVSSKDPKREEHLEKADTDEQVAEWEEASSSIKLSQLAAHYLKHRKRSKRLPSLMSLRKEMLRDKNKALAKYAATKFDARPLNDPRFDSVVVVYNNNNSSLGTGFFIKPDVVLTNWHVVDGAKFVEMKMYDKQETFGKVLAQDVRLDLALVKVQSRGKPVKFYTKKTIDLGATVEAIGHPKQLEFSITRGVISALRRKKTINLGGGGGKAVLFIQTDAPINSGNSGGPLFLGDKVIGVNTWGLTKNIAEGLSFSVHYSEVLDFLKEYLPGYQPGAGG